MSASNEMIPPRQHRAASPARNQNVERQVWLCPGYVSLLPFSILILLLRLCLNIVIGTVLTGVAGLLFALIDPDAPYWAFGFPATIVAVFGADFVFSTGTLFVAKVCEGHEQSVGGALFQTLTQVRSRHPPFSPSLFYSFCSALYRLLSPSRRF